MRDEGGVERGRALCCVRLAGVTSRAAVRCVDSGLRERCRGSRAVLYSTVLVCGAGAAPAAAPLLSHTLPAWPRPTAPGVAASLAAVPSHRSVPPVPRTPLQHDKWHAVQRRGAHHRYALVTTSMTARS